MPFDLALVRPQLPGRRIEWHAILDSTMTEASRLAASGAASGTVVGADEQTAGQGRHGRTWHSEPGSGLYFSVILRHQFPPAILPVVTLALGLAVSEAILKATDVACDLRWPNDVLVQSKKCAGILTALEGSAIIAGIGINVNHSQFPDELAPIATSLAHGRRPRVFARKFAGRTVARDRPLLRAARKRRPRADPGAVFARFELRLRPPRMRGSGRLERLRGTTAGLAESGFLILRGDDGRDHRIIAGGVRPCS